MEEKEEEKEIGLLLLVCVKILGSFLFCCKYEDCLLNSLPFLISVFLPFFLLLNVWTLIFSPPSCFKLVWELGKAYKVTRITCVHIMSECTYLRSPSFWCLSFSFCYYWLLIKGWWVSVAPYCLNKAVSV